MNIKWKKKQLHDRLAKKKQMTNQVAAKGGAVVPASGDDEITVDL